MALNAQGYYNCLKSYLNMAHYEVKLNSDKKIVLKEKIYPSGSQTQIDQKIEFKFNGDAFAIKLDKVNNKGNVDPLFHFLDDNAKPWSKRCDFVIFQLKRSQVFAYCIEFKSASFPDSLVEQLNASVSWCRSLHNIIKNYTGNNKKINLTKYVFSCHNNPQAFLDPSGKYLNRDHTIHHYHYDDLIDIELDDLENDNIEEIR